MVRIHDHDRLVVRIGAPVSPDPHLPDPHLPDPHLIDPRLSRRALLQAGGVSAATLALGISTTETAAAEPLDGDPFTLGVASGSPRATSMVLWTRLATDPLAADGHGGMPARNVPVRWEVATDRGFAEIVEQGAALAQPELAHAVHPQVKGLRPATDYWYRFRVGRRVSPAGRFRTLPAPDRAVSRFTIAAASCQAWYHGHFTAYKHLAAEQELDLVVFLGDYIYEYAILTGGNLWRQNASVTPAEEVEIETLEQYRLRYARFKTDPHLQAAHARAAWVFTWDDHEVENGYGRDYSNDGTPSQLFRHRIAVAYRAFYENLPVSLDALPDGPSTTIYDAYDIGSLAKLIMIDGRQYRDRPATAADRYDPERTLLGRSQEGWLDDTLGASTATWNVIGNSVTLIPVRPDTDVDSWDGYPAARGRLMQSLTAAANPVVLTGDIHRAVAAELPAELSDPTGSKAAVELICTSVGSDGDGAVHDGYADTWLRYPYVKSYDGRRGYLLVGLTPESMESSFVAVDWIEADDTAPRKVAAAYTTPAGTSRLDPVEGADR
jgi:alkaline phosphatase D